MGERCFILFPVWSCWNSAQILCSLENGSLASLDTDEEKQFVADLIDTPSHSPVWIGGHAPLERPGEYQGEEGGACMQMSSKGRDVSAAPCDELKFYVCSTAIGPAHPGVHDNTKNTKLVPGVSVFSFLWYMSETVAEEIRHTYFLRSLRSGGISPSCSTSFLQQEALFLHYVALTLQAVLRRHDNLPSDVKDLLVKTHAHYRKQGNAIQNPDGVDSSSVLRGVLESFHWLVLEDPVYLLVALSARAALNSYLSQSMVLEPSPELSSNPGRVSDSSSRLVFRPAVRHSGSLRSLKKRSLRVQSQGVPYKTSQGSEAGPEQDGNSSPRLVSSATAGPAALFQRWLTMSKKASAMLSGYMSVINRHQEHIDVWKAANIFRMQIVYQKILYKYTPCIPREDRKEEH